MRRLGQRRQRQRGDGPHLLLLVRQPVLDELDEMLRFSTTTFGHGLTEVLVEGYLRREKKGVLGMSSWTTS
jgi:predicted Zn-dependent protease with MMP-like domain